MGCLCSGGRSSGRPTDSIGSDPHLFEQLFVDMAAASLPNLKFVELVLPPRMARVVRLARILTNFTRVFLLKEEEENAEAKQICLSAIPWKIEMKVQESLAILADCGIENDTEINKTSLSCCVSDVYSTDARHQESWSHGLLQEFF